MEQWWYWPAFAVGGLIIGAIGTLVGAGGGFLLMPALVLVSRADARPETLASISLGVVFFNALSGSIGYARQGLIDFRSGKWFLAAGIPGAIAGAFVTSRIPRNAFDLWLGGVLVVVGLFVLVARRPELSANTEPGGSGKRKGAGTGRAAQPPSRLVRGSILSFGVGFASSLLGIGGGIIHVPGMVFLLRFPVHVATATSHFVLAGTSLAGSVSHVAAGDFSHGGWKRTLVIGAGAVVGAQIGAKFAKRTPPGWIMRVLGVALAAVGIRVIAQALGRMG